MKVIEWLGDRVSIIDQTRLPHAEVHLELGDYNSVARAIVEMKVRGAPAIGVAAAYGIALGGLKIKAESKSEFLARLDGVIKVIAGTRPTARNLFTTIGRMKQAASARDDIDGIKKALVNEAIKIHAESYEADMRLSQLGAGLIEDGFSILTHCNTGPLATAGYGTALGIIIQAHEQGKKITVLVDETRPRLQGARLTTWELKRAGVPFRLITDSMAGHFMKRGEVDCVIVGADRIARNGYTANKIGTYSLAVLANAHGIPFYVAAPTSTIDFSLTSGYQIPIEERSPEEVTHIQGVAIAPEGTQAANPAFDITPSQYITAIITEKGIIKKPFGEGIRGVG